MKPISRLLGLFLSITLGLSGPVFALRPELNKAGVEDALNLSAAGTEEDPPEFQRYQQDLIHHINSSRDPFTIELDERGLIKQIEVLTSRSTPRIPELEDYRVIALDSKGLWLANVETGRFILVSKDGTFRTMWEPVYRNENAQRSMLRLLKLIGQSKGIEDVEALRNLWIFFRGNNIIRVVSKKKGLQIYRLPAAGVEQTLDEPQLRLQNAYSDRLQALLNWPRFSNESRYLLRALKEVGPSLERSVQKVLDSSDIRIALFPVGSALKGYASSGSDLEYTLFILKGLPGDPQINEAGKRLILSEAARLLKNRGVQADPGLLRMEMNLPYLGNYSNFTQPRFSFPEDWGKDPDWLSDVAYLFLPMAYGDPELIEQARARFIRFLAQEVPARPAPFNNPAVYWHFVEVSYQERLNPRLFDELRKDHLARWLSAQGVDPTSLKSVEAFNKDRLQKLRLPDFPEMLRIYSGMLEIAAGAEQDLRRVSGVKEETYLVSDRLFSAAFPGRVLAKAVIGPGTLFSENQEGDLRIAGERLDEAQPPLPAASVSALKQLLTKGNVVLIRFSFASSPPSAKTLFAHPPAWMEAPNNVVRAGLWEEKIHLVSWRKDRSFWDRVPIAISRSKHSLVVGLREEVQRIYGKTGAASMFAEVISRLIYSQDNLEDFRHFLKEAFPDDAMVRQLLEDLWIETFVSPEEALQVRKAARPILERSTTAGVEEIPDVEEVLLRLANEFPKGHSIQIALAGALEKFRKLSDAERNFVQAWLHSDEQHSQIYDQQTLNINGGNSDWYVKRVTGEAGLIPCLEEAIRLYPSRNLIPGTDIRLLANERFRGYPHPSSQAYGDGPEEEFKRMQDYLRRAFEDFQRFYPQSFDRLRKAVRIIRLQHSPSGPWSSKGWVNVPTIPGWLNLNFPYRDVAYAGIAQEADIAATLIQEIDHLIWDGEYKPADVSRGAALKKGFAFSRDPMNLGQGQDNPDSYLMEIRGHAYTADYLIRRAQRILQNPPTHLAPDDLAPILEDYRRYISQLLKQVEDGIQMLQSEEGQRVLSSRGKQLLEGFIRQQAEHHAELQRLLPAAGVEEIPAKEAKAVRTALLALMEKDTFVEAIRITADGRTAIRVQHAWKSRPRIESETFLQALTPNSPPARVELIIELPAQFKERKNQADLDFILKRFPRVLRRARELSSEQGKDVLVRLTSGITITIYPQESLKAVRAIVRPKGWTMEPQFFATLDQSELESAGAEAANERWEQQAEAIVLEMVSVLDEKIRKFPYGASELLRNSQIDISSAPREPGQTAYSVWAEVSRTVDPATGFYSNGYSCVESSNWIAQGLETSFREAGIPPGVFSVRIQKGRLPIYSADYLVEVIVGSKRWILSATPGLPTLGARFIGESSFSSEAWNAVSKQREAGFTLHSPEMGTAVIPAAWVPLSSGYAAKISVGILPDPKKERTVIFTYEVDLIREGNPSTTGDIILGAVLHVDLDRLRPVRDALAQHSEWRNNVLDALDKQLGLKPILVHSDGKEDVAPIHLSGHPQFDAMQRVFEENQGILYDLVARLRSWPSEWDVSAAGTEQLTLEQRLDVIAEAMPGGQALAVQAPGISGGVEMAEFLVRLPREARLKKMVLGAGSLAGLELAARGDLIYVDSDDPADWGAALAGLEAERAVFLGEQDAGERLRRILPEMPVTVLSQGAGLEGVLLSLGLPADLLHRINAAGTEQLFERDRSA